MIERLYDLGASNIGSDKTAYAGWLVGVLCWVLGFIYVSEAGIDAYASSLTRGLALMLFNLPGMLETGFCSVSYRGVWLMTLRNIFMIAYGVLFAEAFFYLPINVMHTVYASGPFFVLTMDYLLYGVAITSRQSAGMGLSFLGVLLTVLGPSLYGGQFTSDFGQFRPEAANTWVQVGVTGLLVLGLFMWAYSIVLVKEVKQACQYTHYEFSFQMGLVIWLFSALLYPRTTLSPDLRLSQFWICLVASGLVLAVGQSFYTMSLKTTNNYGVMSMLSFVGVALSYAIKIFRYHQDTNLVCLAGCLLIVFGVYLIVITKS